MYATNYFIKSFIHFTSLYYLLPVSLQIKELEDTKENTQKLLQETQNTLATLIIKTQAMDKENVVSTEVQSNTPLDVKSKSKAKPKNVDAIVEVKNISTEEALLTGLRELKPYQVLNVSTASYF